MVIVHPSILDAKFEDMSMASSVSLVSSFGCDGFVLFTDRSISFFSSLVMKYKAVRWTCLMVSSRGHGEYSRKSSESSIGP